LLQPHLSLARRQDRSFILIARDSGVGDRLARIVHDDAREAESWGVIGGLQGHGGRKGNQQFEEAHTAGSRFQQGLQYGVELFRTKTFGNNAV